MDRSARIVTGEEQVFTGREVAGGWAVGGGIGEKTDKGFKNTQKDIQSSEKTPKNASISWPLGLPPLWTPLNPVQTDYRKSFVEA